MRKFYSTLKSVVAAALVGAMTLAASCSYDDTAIKNDVEQIKSDLAALNERVTALEGKLQTEIDAVKALIDGLVVVVDVVTDANGNQTIKLSNGKEITVLAPVECTCDNLQYRVVDGELQVSADGQNWLTVHGVLPECVVANIVVNENGTATVTLADGQVFDVVVAELVEFEAAKSAIYVKVGETIAVPFAINDAVADINVMNQPLGWKAEVVDTRAVGGMDFALNITGPSKDFLQYAEKSGKVSIHFNTAAGACKVMSVDVELAEIKLDVDKAGNITIEHTMVDRYVYTDWYGNSEDVVEFNNFYFAIFDYDDYYACNGDLESVYNANWGEFNIPAVAAYINNFFTNVGENDYTGAIYEEGVNEKWTIKFTVEEVIAYLDWYEQFVYEKNSFVVCVLPTDVHNNAAIIWDEAIVVPFKQLCLEIAENVDNRTFQQPYFDVKFRGAEKYFFYPQTLSSLQEYVEWGYYEDEYGYFEEALASYMQYPDWYSFGYEVTADIVESNISLAELLAYTSTYYYFETQPATDYLMAYFAWEEGKTEYTAEDLQYIRFSTAGLTKAEPAYEIGCEYNEEHNLFTIAVDVTVPESAVVAYTAWMTEEPADEEELYNYILENGYARTEEDLVDAEYSIYVGTSCSNPKTTKYLGVLVIDAEGNYTMEYFTLTSKDVVLNAAEVSIEKVEFAEASATITVGGVDGLEVSAYQYYIISKTSGSSYYQKTEEQLADIAYSDNYLYKTTDVNPIVATSTADYKYVFNVGDTYAIAVGVQFADGTFSAPVYKEVVYSAGDEEGDEEVEAEVLVMDNVVRANYKNSKLQFFHQVDGANVYCAGFSNYDAVNTEGMFVPEGEYVVGTNFYVYGYSNVYDYVAKGYNYNFDEGGVMKVSEVNGAYHVEFSGTLNDGAVVLEFVYDGLIENLILPSEYKAPVAYAFTPVRAEYDNKLDGNNDSEYAYKLYDEAGNCLFIESHFCSNSGWDQVTTGKMTYADGAESTVTKVKATQMPSTHNCEEGENYYSIDVILSDNNQVTFAGQVSTTAVDML